MWRNRQLAALKKVKAKKGRETSTRRQPGGRTNGVKKNDEGKV